MTHDKQSEKNQLADKIEELIAAQKKRNKLAKKQNKLAAAELKQKQYTFEQTERLYLIEKSKLQPKFKLNVTEFLLCEPDYMNDPEQAGEAKFLTDLGFDIDERILRFQLNLVEKEPYLRPRLIVSQTNNKADGEDFAFSLTDKLYFLPFSLLSMNAEETAFDAYFVYQDQTTLPVIQRYRVSQRPGSSLMRWNATHEDTVFAVNKESLTSLNSAEGCAKLFVDRF